MEKKTTNLYKAYKTNPTLETEGVRLDFGGPVFIIRRSGGSNRKYQAAFNERTRPHARAIANDTLDIDKQKQIMLGVFWETVMVGWENVEDEEGNPMEFNKENFYKLMMDLPDLWIAVRTEAEDRKNFQAEEIKTAGEDLGN